MQFSFHSTLVRGSLIQNELLGTSIIRSHHSGRVGNKSNLLNRNYRGALPRTGTEPGQKRSVLNVWAHMCTDVALAREKLWFCAAPREEEEEKNKPGKLSFSFAVLMYRA